MSLIAKLNYSGSPDYYNKSFRAHLESHVPLMKADPQVRVLPVSDHEANVFRGDLFSLLAIKDIPSYQHWIIMRLNGFLSPRDFHESGHLLIPSDELLERYRQTWNTQVRVTV